MGEELNFGDLLAGLLGGVALLLFGMGRITDAMKLIAGERLKVPSRTSAFCKSQLTRCTGAAQLPQQDRAAWLLLRCAHLSRAYVSLPELTIST